MSENPEIIDGHLMYPRRITVWCRFCVGGWWDHTFFIMELLLLISDFLLHEMNIAKNFKWSCYL